MKTLFRVILLAFALGSTTALAEPLKHNYDLKHVLWKLSFDAAKGTITGDVTNTLTLSEKSKTVQFHCSDLAIGKVTVDGAIATFNTKDDKLTVNLATAANAGQTIKVRTIYTGSPQIGFYFVPASRAFPAKTGMVYTQGQGEDNHYWLPTYDYPDDKATSECFVEVPLKWTAISNGLLAKTSMVGKTKVFHWKMNQPHSTYLISLVAGEYVEVKDRWRNIPVSYFVPPGLEKEGKASFAVTPKMIELFSTLTGVDYPFDKFAQEVVGDFIYGGMENTTAVTQTIRTLHKPDTEPVNDSTGLVAHELAHQWFGDLITCRTWEHSWLNEGFASALPIFWNRATRGQDAYDLDRYHNFEGAVNSIGSRGRKDVPGVVGSVAAVTVGSVYDGGASRIMMLFREMGEETFWKAIKAFLEKYSFQPATTDEFFQVMNEVSGKDFSAFAKQWFHTTSTPSLTATIKGRDLVISQLQPHYTLDLPVWILVDDAWVKRNIRVAGAESKMELGDLVGKPLLIDPEVWTTMELRYAIPYSEQDVMSLYRHAPNAAQRARIVSGLFDSIPVKQRIALGHGEKFYGLLQMIAPKITAEGGWYLAELTRHPDKRVVNAAVQTISGQPSSAAMVTRLREIAESDPNEAIRENAMRGLLGWSTDPALALKAWKLKAFDDGFRRMALDWWGKNSPGLARQKALAVLAKPDSEALRITAIQVLGKVKEAPGQEVVFTALMKVARETSYSARCNAVTALGDLGNKKAIPILQPLARRAAGNLPGLAQQALEKLKKV